MEEERRKEMIYPPQASLFKEKLLVFFSSTRKTGWGKKEVVNQIKDCYIEFLEDLQGREEKENGN